jgi:hypothetical protein
VYPCLCVEQYIPVPFVELNLSWFMVVQVIGCAGSMLTWPLLLKGGVELEIRPDMLSLSISLTDPVACSLPVK